MPAPVYPSKPRPGDKVAVISPSAGLPGLLPMPYELGLRRLRQEFGLIPVEYPTSRKMGSTPRERAADLHAAFADPEIRAVITSIGGDDQITVLPHLDAELIKANPKPFFGYSDNTCLLAYLYGLGIVGYHGGAVMVQFGRPVAMDPTSADSLWAALFKRGEYELAPADNGVEVFGPWDEPRTFDVEPATVPYDGWLWHHPDRVVEGIGWGGNLEVLSWLLMADRAVAPADGVLFVETSEEMPSADEVYRILRGMGERGLLARFPAALVGRPQTWALNRRTTAEQRAAYRKEQRESVFRAFAEYHPAATLVFDVDFGHTDPQVVLPYGGTIRVDGPARRISVTY